MKSAVIALAAALVVAGASAAGDFNFFPAAALLRAGEAGAAAAAEVKPSPSAWTFAAQSAYPDLGNAEGRGVLKISVNDYYPDAPTLYVSPGLWCDTPGAAVAGPQPAGLTPRGTLAPGAGVVVAASVPDGAAPAAAATAGEIAAASIPATATTPATTAAPAGDIAAASIPATATPATTAPAGEIAAASIPATATPAATAPAAAAAAPGGAPRRMLLQDAAPDGEAAAPADAGAVLPESTPVSNPLFMVDDDGACELSPEAPVTFRVNGGEAQAAEAVNVAGMDVYKVALPPTLPDGPVCVDITAKFNTGAVKTTPPYADMFQPLGDVTSVTRTVCLHKLTKQADATLDFDMCTNNEFTLKVSGVSPLPVNLTLDTAPLDKPLFRPLVKVWGGKVAELDGTPTEPRNYDEVASRTQYNWVARYFPISAGYKGEALDFVLSDTLQEGYYELNSVVSVLTEYPELNSLIGLTQITQDDASGAEVRGLWEAAARQLHTRAIVGVQKGSTPTTLSAISSSSHAPGQAVLPGQRVALNWQFRGVGSATCTHDGAEVSNTADGKCVSPLSVGARDVGAEDSKHSVVVTFTDVCGRKRTAEFMYTQAGVKPLTESEVLRPDGTIEKIPFTYAHGVLKAASAPSDGAAAGAGAGSGTAVKSAAGARAQLAGAAAALVAGAAALLL